MLHVLRIVGTGLAFILLVPMSFVRLLHDLKLVDKRHSLFKRSVVDEGP